MPLATGLRLGVYAILNPLGSGGMGEVYRARDTRLGREVAVKALPEEFSRDPARLSRFEREARMLAALNHPAVAAIYGLEEVDGTSFIVMELVPGETLSQKLARGALSIVESLKISGQIAEALEAAHDRGIVHRDLKPANIKVTPDGRVKVLDLGLAKAFDTKEGGSDADLSLSPTLVIEGTQPGVILGTAEFMSPEQARGKPVGKQTDIWAFGCVLYEMLSGRRAFTGDTATDVLVAIVTTEPKWEALPPETPLRIRDLLAHCLQKDLSSRLHDIGDARIEIEEALAEIREGRTPRSGISAPVALPTLPRRRRGPALAIVLAAVVVLALGGAWLAVRWRQSTPSARAAEKKYLAILPFKDLSGRPDGQLLGDGLAESIRARLSAVPLVQIVRPTADAALSPQEPDLHRVVQKTGASLVLTGTVQRSGDRVRATYSLLQAPQGVQVGGHQATGAASDIFAIEDEIAENVLLSLGLKASLPSRRPSGLKAPAAQEQYLKAIGKLQRYDVAASVDEAIQSLAELARTEPESAIVQAALGRAYLHKYELTRDRAWAEKAAGACERAKNLDSELPEAHMTLGQLLALTGRPVDAALEFDRALAERPNLVEALLGLAAAQKSAGKISEAEATYRRAIALQPNYWAVYNHFGAFYFSRGQYSKAIEMFQKVVGLEPDSVRGYNNLGAAYHRSGEFAQARAAYRRSIRLKPSDGGAYSNLGATEYFLGNYRNAATALEQAVKLTPGKFLYWANLADAYRWTPELRSRAPGTYDRAVRLAEQALSLNPRDASAHATLAVCFAKTGNLATARVHVDRALEIEPDDPQHLYDAAIVAVLDGKPPEAINLIRSAIARGLAARVVESEPEFKSLRDRPEFRDALAVKRVKS